MEGGGREPRLRARQASGSIHLVTTRLGDSAPAASRAEPLFPFHSFMEHIFPEHLECPSHLLSSRMTKQMWAVFAFNICLKRGQ